ncbi:hypothetical protein [Rathayibacter sp. AY1B4]|uniref:hypothetical protein n=1 Tax=Rathayibacter sp. AY1B4 TaxID=2080529 RepID=UPI000CE91746|nr:hypothetical protein [Rathayibacter sp. AY1B4]PPI27946.1 hypothetical protein C5D66_15110 [Rathayibacter sp. AY1B4]
MSTLHFAGPNLHLHTPAAVVHHLLKVRRVVAGRHCAARPRSRRPGALHWATTTEISIETILRSEKRISTALLELRHRSGYTLLGAAEVAGTNALTMFCIERGDLRRCTIVMLLRLVSAYSKAINSGARP